MAQQALGIDCSNGTVQAIRVEGSAKKFKIAGFASAPIVAGEEGDAAKDPVANTLKEILDLTPGAKDTTALVVSSARCTLRPLTLPFVGDEQIRKVVKFELEGHLHQWSIDDVIVDYYTVSEDKGQSQLLVVAAPKDYLRDIFKSCEKAGTDPLVADLDATALFNAALACGALEDLGTHVFLHIKEQHAILLVVENRTLKLSRSIRIAAAPVAKAPAAPPAEAGADPTAAPAATPAEAPAPETQPLPPMPELEGEGEEVFLSIEDDVQGVSGISNMPGKDVNALLIRETSRSLTALRLQTSLSRIYISGAWEKVEGMAAAFEQKFHQPLRVFDIFEWVEHSLTEEEVQQAAPHAAIAFGAALKLIGVDVCGINLRQEELRFTKRFDQIKRELSLLVCCIAIIFALENAFLFKKNQKLRTDYDNWFVEAQKQAQGLTDSKYTLPANGDPLKKIAGLRRLVEDDAKKLNEKMGKADDLKQPQSSFDAWKLFFAALKEIEPKIEPFLIEKMDIVSRDGSTREKEPFVDFPAVDIVFLGDSVKANGSFDALVAHLKSKSWKINEERTDVKTFPGGIRTTLKFDMKVPEVAQ